MGKQIVKGEIQGASFYKNMLFLLFTPLVHTQRITGLESGEINSTN